MKVNAGHLAKLFLSGALHKPREVAVCETIKISVPVSPAIPALNSFHCKQVPVIFLYFAGSIQQIYYEIYANQFQVIQAEPRTFCKADET